MLPMNQVCVPSLSTYLLFWSSNCPLTWDFCPPSVILQEISVLCVSRISVLYLSSYPGLLSSYLEYPSSLCLLTWDFCPFSYLLPGISIPSLSSCLGYLSSLRPLNWDFFPVSVLSPGISVLSFSFSSHVNPLFVLLAGIINFNFNFMSFLSRSS